jgi:signal transduction histidine kinase
MWMLMLVWRMLAKVLRRLGWGLLLVPVAAMGVVLFGLSVWTFGAVLLAAIIAVQWPGVAARLLPPAMVGAGVSGLVEAGRISGSPVNLMMQSIQGRAAQVNGYLPPGAPGSPRWYFIGPKGRFQLSFSVPQFRQMVVNAKAQAGRALANATTTVRPGPKGQVIIQKGRVVIQRKITAKLPPGKGQLVPLHVFMKGKPPASVTIIGSAAKGGPPLGGIGAGQGTLSAAPGVFKNNIAAIHAGASWRVSTPVLRVAGLWHGRLLVPVALLLLTLGLWLTPRTLAGLRGRGATLAPEVRRWLVENRWGVLLIPVTLLGLTVFGVHPWTIAAIIAAILILARWPRVAADLVPVTLAVFAVRGFELAANWQSMSAALQGPLFNRPPAGPGVLFGAIDVNSPGTALLAGAEASAFLALGAWLVPRTIAAHARNVFTPEADLELEGRVQRLTESRSHAVDTATAELRRIERDLHDGAQARLVALGMNLRAVEKVLPVNPQAALALVAEARDASGRALSELRDLIRGICPPVLADRGLGHAVRALALDTPLPTELEIDLPGRLSAPVESACYFAVAEALANAVKHSGARRVQIHIKHAANVLRVEVADDGVGGADPAAGTGLQGVERRLGTFDGILAVSSPPGGPTMIVMEVPCALLSPKTSSC